MNRADNPIDDVKQLWLDAIARGELSIRNYQSALAISWDINFEDLEDLDFWVKYFNLDYVKSVNYYSIDPFKMEGTRYDGAYRVVYKDGTKAIYGWFTNNTNLLVKIKDILN